MKRLLTGAANHPPIRLRRRRSHPASRRLSPKPRLFPPGGASPFPASAASWRTKNSRGPDGTAAENSAGADRRERRARGYGAALDPPQVARRLRPAGLRPRQRHARPRLRGVRPLCRARALDAGRLGARLPGALPVQHRRRSPPRPGDAAEDRDAPRPEAGGRRRDPAQRGARLRHGRDLCRRAARHGLSDVDGPGRRHPRRRGRGAAAAARQVRAEGGDRRARARRPLAGHVARPGAEGADRARRHDGRRDRGREGADRRAPAPAARGHAADHAGADDHGEQLRPQDRGQ